MTKNSEKTSKKTSDKTPSNDQKNESGRTSSERRLSTENIQPMPNSTESVHRKITAADQLRNIGVFGAGSGSLENSELSSSSPMRRELSMSSTPEYPPLKKHKNSNQLGTVTNAIDIKIIEKQRLSESIKNEINEYNSEKEKLIDKMEDDFKKIYDCAYNFDRSDPLKQLKEIYSLEDQYSSNLKDNLMDNLLYSSNQDAKDTIKSLQTQLKDAENRHRELEKYSKDWRLKLSQFDETYKIMHATHEIQQERINNLDSEIQEFQKKEPSSDAKEKQPEEITEGPQQTRETLNCESTKTLERTKKLEEMKAVLEKTYDKLNQTSNAFEQKTMEILELLDDKTDIDSKLDFVKEEIIEEVMRKNKKLDELGRIKEEVLYDLLYQMHLADDHQNLQKEKITKLIDQSYDDLEDFRRPNKEEKELINILTSQATKEILEDIVKTERDTMERVVYIKFEDIINMMPNKDTKTNNWAKYTSLNETSKNLTKDINTYRTTYGSHILNTYAYNETIDNFKKTDSSMFRDFKKIKTFDDVYSKFAEEEFNRIKETIEVISED